MLAAEAITLSIYTIAAFSAALAAIGLTSLARRAAGLGRNPVPMPGSAEEAEFLFDGDWLIDANLTGRRLMDAAPEAGSDRARLFALLDAAFGSLATRLDELAEKERVELPSGDGRLTLIARRHDGPVRMTLAEQTKAEAPAPIDSATLHAMERELSTLRAVTDRVPALVWRQDAAGRITWINRAYLDTLRRLRGDAAAAIWPPAPLFDPSQPPDSGHSRLPLQTGDGPSWYDSFATPLGQETLFTATDASDVVAAETRLAELTQTLSRTFASLATGLAVFDRSRQLTLFNPALTDLTTLPPEFLAGRPSLPAFLDKLRERQMIPEPRNYKSWRSRITELEAAAADGTYRETWTLPMGRTYRVTGQPHMDGAVAFLFEDISAEIALTRRFRSELDLGQAVLDSLDEAIAVFSRSGVLTLSNASYAALWGADPGTGLKDITVVDASRTWLARSVPSPFWGDLRQFVLDPANRAEWTGDVRLRDGRGLDCRVVPIQGGATLVGFTVVPPIPLDTASDEMRAPA